MHINKKKQWRPPSKRKKRGKKPKPKEQEGTPQRQYCPLESVAEKGTQSAMKSNKKTLHEFTSHIPQKRRKGT
jgi:hypothetical protein